MQKQFVKKVQFYRFHRSQEETAQPGAINQTHLNN